MYTNVLQYNSCRFTNIDTDWTIVTVTDDRLTWLPSGGECVLKPYVQFTHLCSVSNYLPTVDYCCCVIEHRQPLCCRYHQNWNHFRCIDTEDAVGTAWVDIIFTFQKLWKLVLIDNSGRSETRGICSYGNIRSSTIKCSDKKFYFPFVLQFNFNSNNYVYRA